MIKAAIYHTGLHGIDKPEPSENWEGTSLDALRSRLWNLQNKYCEGPRDKPMVMESTATMPSGRIRTIVKSSSKVDYGYLAIVGTRFKPGTKLQSDDRIPAGGVSENGK